MWLTTVDGFFSIVDKSPEGDDWLLVRARDEQSLIDMKQRMVDFVKNNDVGALVKTPSDEGIMWQGRFWMGERREGAGTDYEWRMDVPRALLMGYFNLTVDDLHYSNFKSAAEFRWTERHGEHVGTMRAIAIGEVWEQIHSLWPRIKLRPSSSD